MAFAVSASPSQPGLPFTMDGDTGAITWYPATAAFPIYIPLPPLPPIPVPNFVDYYSWQLYLNGALASLTQRANTSLPPAATFDGTIWTDDLDNGIAGTVTPLGPGHYDLAIYAVDVEDMPTPNSLTQTQHFTILPLTPTVAAVEEVWNPDGTYHITWSVQPGVESAYVEWTVNGVPYNSGWIANSGAYDTGAIDPLYFWDANSISVIVRDTESMLSSLPGTTTINATPWAPETVTLNVTGAPDWVINYSYAAPGVDPDYFEWRLYGSYYGYAIGYITQGIEDGDKNFAIDFNPVDDSTLSNIYETENAHYWTMTVQAFAPDDGEAGGSNSASPYGIPYGTPSIVANVTLDPDANPWVFTVTYHDDYNDYAWGIKGPTGYINNVWLRFIYDGSIFTENEFPTMVPLATGEIQLTVNPGADLSNPNFVNKYNDWSVEATPRVYCPTTAMHEMGMTSMAFETVCPPFAAPAPGATYYGAYPPGTQVPEYVVGPYPSGGPVPNTFEQGVTSGLSLTTAWQLPAKPLTYYGNDLYLQSFVEYQDSTAFAGPYSLFSQHDVPWDNDTHSRVFGTPPASVTFYKAIVNMQYNNFGDALGGGSGSFEDVSPDAEIDNWEVDDLNPDPATAKTMVEEPITEAFGNPWTFTFVAPLTPDFDEWQAFLREMTFGPAITVSPWTLSYPGALVTWTVDQATFESDITPFLPFGDPFGWYRFGVRTSDNTVPSDNDFMDGNNMDPLVFEYTLYDALGKITDLDKLAGSVSIEMLTAERVRASWRAVDHKPFGVFLTNIHYKAQLQYLDPNLGAWIAVDETDFIYPYTPGPGVHLTDPVMHAEFCAGDYDYPAGDYRVKVYYGYEMPMGGWLYDDAGSAMSDQFEIEFEGFAMAAPTAVNPGMLTGFSWVSPDLDLANEPHIMEYQVEVYGANGLEHDETLSGETMNLAFDPAAWWPHGNVYSTYRARVRAVDSLGRTGDWSPLSAEGNFPLPLISAYLFDVRHADGSIANPSTPMTDRELRVTFGKFDVAPAGFINWDPNKVTFDLQVDVSIPLERWYYALLQNQFIEEGHVVPVGVEDYVKDYMFYFRPLYDGVPMMSAWSQKGPFTIDLQGPAAPTGLGVTVNPVTAGPTFDWDFNWNDMATATTYDLTINRLSAAGGAVDATHIAKGLTVSELLNFSPATYFSDRVYGFYNCSVVAYDSLGNASLPATATFSQGLPSLNVSTVTASSTQISWATSIERVSYDVKLVGDNGLEYEWENLTTSPLAINLATLFAGQNVYTKWVAYVRAYDRDGNVGDWYSGTFTLSLPNFTGLTFEVYKSDSTVAPVSPTKMIDRELFVRWAEYNTVPAGFINWDKSKVTFQLKGQLSIDSTRTLDVVEINNGETSVLVPVGEAGKEIGYTFTVDMFYDGVLVTQSAILSKGVYVIDLKAPTAASPNAPTIDRAGAPTSYKVNFMWSTASDPVNYDVIVNRLSNVSGAVDATYVQTNVTTPYLSNFELTTHFGDRVFGDYEFMVVSRDSMGNTSTSSKVAFSVPAPAKTISSVTLTQTLLSWSAAAEAVKYDMWIMSDNGLEFIWQNYTGTSVAIDLAILFPGKNVYTRWTARVRAYDRDGNAGLWYSNVATFGLPNFSALSFEVYKFDGSVAPVSPTKMNVRDLFVKWAEYNSMPAGFINWDKTKVTFQLKAQLSIDSTQSIDVVGINNGETNVQVPVGEVGKEIGYSFTVDMFYDGVKVTQVSPVTKQTYVIDLKAPGVPTGLVHNIAVAPWTFSWVNGGGADTTGYVFELQKRDPVTGLVINDYTLDLTGTSTTVNPLELNWSVFGSYWWRVSAYDQFRNLSSSGWVSFVYTLNSAIAPWSMNYELVGEENSIWDFILEFSNKRTALFSWSVPSVPVIGLDMEQVDYVFELQKSTGAGWVNVKEYSLTWNPTYMESEVTVGITDETTYYRGRVRAEYQTEQTGWIYSNVFAIDLERPEFIEGAEAPSYSSTDEEYPSWLFTWDIATDEEVGLGGFLFVLERLEGDTTHAIAMIDLPVEYEEPEDDSIGAYSFGFEEGKYLLEMDPFEYVETIDGIFRYTVIPYDRLENLGGPIAGEFTSVWSGGGNYGTYPFINLYDNWMGEKQLIGTVNNNTYATISFDIFGLEGYTLEFRLNGTLLVEGTDFRLIDSPYGSDLYYLVLLESVRDMIQADDMGELEIYAYVEEDDIVVQFTVDAFSYIYLNQRTGFGFGRFRPALND